MKLDPSHYEVSAQDLFDKYPSFLKKGFAIEHLPNVHQALAGYISFSCKSHERLLLKDFVQSAARARRAGGWRTGCSLRTAASCSGPGTCAAPGPPSSPL